MEFKIVKKSKKSRARLGIIKTPHGWLHTPAFLPVASKATVKTLNSLQIEEIGFEAILCNTYHLFLRPGADVIEKLGGLHKFMNWKKVIVTDSGGFQVFSLGRGIEHGIGKIVKFFPGEKIPLPPKAPSLVKINDDGVVFKSHIDGKEYFFTPEDSIKVQEKLGADIIFAFDECSSPLDDFEKTKEAVERTHLWAKRCIKAHRKKRQALFGVIQGGEWKSLRQESAKFISSLPFDGFGIGGPLGRTKSRLFEILDWTIPLLPEHKPRHLLGIGYLEDLKEAVKRGIDLFDCVHPTRIARHGMALTKNGRIDLTKKKFLKDKKPIERKCKCFVCRNFSRAYICHLFRVKELTALSLLSFHNLWMIFEEMKKIRQEIKKGKL